MGFAASTTSGGLHVSGIGNKMDGLIDTEAHTSTHTHAQWSCFRHAHSREMQPSRAAHWNAIVVARFCDGRQCAIIFEISLPHFFVLPHVGLERSVPRRREGGSFINNFICSSINGQRMDAGISIELRSRERKKVVQLKMEMVATLCFWRLCSTCFYKG